MNAPGPEQLSREDRLNQVLLDYLEEVQNGQSPDRQQLLARQPEFVAELTEFLACRAQLESFRRALHSATTALIDHGLG